MDLRAKYLKAVVGEINWFQLIRNCNEYNTFEKIAHQLIILKLNTISELKFRTLKIAQNPFIRFT